MTKLGKRAFTKILCVILSVGMLAAAGSVFTGCSSATQRATITVSFTGYDADGKNSTQEFDLKFKLYDKMYPQTVRRFVELADAGFYNGMIVHDFNSSSHMKTGAYVYENANSLYSELIKKDFPGDVNLTQSVSYNGEYTNSLYGEFGDNGYQVAKNPLVQTYGSLVMYYDAGLNQIKDFSTRVTVNLSNRDETAERLLMNNAATSEFYISLTTNNNAGTKYCTFGEIINDDVLDELTAFIDNYKVVNLNKDADYKFVESVSDVEMFAGDSLLDTLIDDYTNEDSPFNVPVQRITVKEVKITKH